MRQKLAAARDLLPRVQVSKQLMLKIRCDSGRETAEGVRPQ